jgi:hypothetical protein
MRRTDRPPNSRETTSKSAWRPPHPSPCLRFRPRLEPENWHRRPGGVTMARGFLCRLAVAFAPVAFLKVLLGCVLLAAAVKTIASHR